MPDPGISFLRWVRSIGERTRHSWAIPFRDMNPNRDRAVETRIRALADQVEGLTRESANERNEVYVDRRLRDTRTELADLVTGAVSSLRRRVPE